MLQSLFTHTNLLNFSRTCCLYKFLFRSVLLLSIFLVSGSLCGQDNRDLVTIQSPNVSSIRTYGNIPVSLFTGTPDISVPLFTLSGKSLSYPLSLHYHIGNLKPNQRSGWLGSCWSLPVGTIYREVRGFPDDLDTKALVNKSGSYYHGRLLLPDWPHIVVDSLSDPFHRLSYHKSLEDLHVDMEPDIFHFNIMGIQGRFFLDEDGKWCVESDHYFSVSLAEPVAVFPPLGYSCPNPAIVSTNFNRFILKDGLGNTYIFGGVGATEYSVRISDLEPKNVDPNHLDNARYEISSMTANSWHLTEIHSPNMTENIVFEYDRGPFVSTLYKYSIYNTLYKDNDNHSSEYYNWHTDGVLISPVYLKRIVMGSQEFVFHTSVSNEINYEKSDYLGIDHNPTTLIVQGLNDFIQKSKSSIPYYVTNIVGDDYYRSIIWLKLDRIDYLINGKKTKSALFLYNNNVTERLFLESLHLLDSSNHDVEQYNFSYKNRSHIPKYLGTITDHWGYSNGNPFGNFSAESIFSRRHPESSYLTNGILTDIRYPTGGRSHFEYELGDYSQVVNNTNRHNLDQYIGQGGIRVSSISTYHSGDNISLKKEFIYKRHSLSGGKLSSGILQNRPLYYIHNLRENDESGSPFTYSSFRSSSVLDLTDDSGVSIGYSEVLEKSISPSAEEYTIHYYTNHDNGFSDDNPVYRYHPQLLINTRYNSRSFERGREKQVSYYDSSKNKLRSIYNEWIPSYSEVYSSRAIMYNIYPIARTIDPTYYSLCCVSYRNYYYPVFLKSTIDTLFHGSMQHITSRIYQYNDDYKFKTEEFVYDSSEDLYRTSYTYPIDYESSSNPLYKKMMSRNMFAYPIEILEYKQNQIINGSLNEYTDYSGILVPKSRYTLSCSQPVSVSEFSRYNGSKIDSRYRIDSEVLKIDSSGNPLVVKDHHSGITTVYIWGYENRLYPIAKIDNATYETVSGILGVALTDYFNTPTPDLSKLQYLRLSPSLCHSQITTYTYKPYIGLTSITDTNALTTYYVYDLYGRLISVKDTFGNELYHNKYYFHLSPDLLWPH